MEWEDLKGILIVIGSTFILFLFVGCIVMQTTYLVERVHVRVFIDGKDVYHGRSACVDTESVGSSSRVNTKTGPWCMFPKQYFAGKNLVIKTEQSDD